ncbi:4Fe-4S binding protein [Candidatus Altiarchaeota archaeon]
MNVGVFICHCGQNIAKAVDIKKLKDEISSYPGVTYVEDYIYLCSDPGQTIVKDRVKEEALDAVVIANCSPTLHEKTFRRAVEQAGLNPFCCEIANIREQCSWPHGSKPEEATQKATEIIKMAIEKVRLNSGLQPISAGIEKKALVIGGGVTGIQAALDIAEGGFEVYLVEREPSIGGRMAQLSETFPTLDCPQCILTPKMTDVNDNPNIHLLTYSEVEDVSGYVGNFKVKIRQKAKYVDWEKCTGCGVCTERCPTKTKSEFDFGLGDRKAIYKLFPQAVPNKPVIDAKTCLKLTKNSCGICEKVCEVKAIAYKQKDKFLEFDVGAIIVATGFDLMLPEEIGEYGYGRHKDVITGIEFERLLAASGPTNGEVRRPSNGKVPTEVVFIQCVGSRDPELHKSYCSKICCMYTGKQAMLYKHSVPEGQAYVFYIDIRSSGKGYEEFIQRAMEEDGVIYLRGKVSKVFEENGKIRVWGVDTLTGKNIEVDADLVVLASAMIPGSGIKDLAQKLRIATDTHGWLTEAHLKLRPFETLTSGVYIAGAAQFPKDITDSVAQGSAAAAKILGLFSKDSLLHEPTIAEVDEEVCTGCGKCADVCVYQAIEVDEGIHKAKVNECLCEGCGNCSATCPSGAIKRKNYTRKQVFEMIDAVA